jgi:uncharacterized integral membrane protein
MAKVKLIVALILAVVSIIVVAQNTEAVETRLLVATITMPRAVLLLICMAIGFVLGLLFSFGTTGKRKTPPAIG